MIENKSIKPKKINYLSESMYPKNKNNINKIQKKLYISTNKKKIGNVNRTAENN